MLLVCILSVSNDQMCSNMKQIPKPRFFQILLVFSVFMLTGIGLSAQKLDSLLLKKTPGKPRPQVEIKEVKEDTIKSPAGTDLGSIDELLNKRAEHRLGE